MAVKDLLTKKFLRREYVEKRKSYETIAKEVGCSSTGVEYWVKQHGLLGKRAHLTLEDLSGQRFGRWEVLSQAPSRKHSRGAATRWNCKCDCGTEKVVMAASLRSGKSKSCGCLCHDMFYRGYKELSGTYWTQLKTSAKQRGHLFEITKEYAWELLQSQKMLCALTGLTLTISRKWTAGSQTASIDRIDPKKGYIEGNVRWIHKDVNSIRWKFNDETFLRYCQLIVENAEQ